MKRSPYIEVDDLNSEVMTGRYRITRTSYPSHARSFVCRLGGRGTPPDTETHLAIIISGNCIGDGNPWARGHHH